MIDAATHAVTDTIVVGTGPTGIAIKPDGTLVYVANALSNTVSVIDAVTNAVIATVAVGQHPSAVAPTAPGSMLRTSSAIRFR